MEPEDREHVEGMARSPGRLEDCDGSTKWYDPSSAFVHREKSALPSRTDSVGERCGMLVFAARRQVVMSG
jgi:hypothetical protein